VTLWQGRLPGRPAPEMLAFTESLSFDRALASDDLEGSRAHVRGLQRAGLLSAEEAAILVTALDRVGEEIAEGRFEPTETDEDIHTAVERRVTEMAGEVGAKLHTGRSRNDQVATDLRLYTPTCPATPTSSGPSRSFLPTICWPTAGRWPETSIAWPRAQLASTSAPSAPAPWPARRCPWTPRRWRLISASPTASRTRSTP
jgi:hypothetical protein